MGRSSIILSIFKAVNNLPSNSYFNGDILKQLHLEPNDHIGMVGNFGPLIPAIKANVKALYIFEQIDFPQGNLLPIAV
jgi:uncharacterized protein (DUF4213/DUF364 family)